MKFLAVLPIFAASCSALSLFRSDQAVIGNSQLKQYLVELSPGKVLWISEDEKWELRRVGC